MVEIIKKDEIDIWAEATALTKPWAMRDNQMRADREVINLVKPEQTTDNVKWMSNEPKVFFETSKALISSYPPRFRMPLSMNFSPDEKERMSKAERFVLGIFRQLDYRVQQTGDPNAFWMRGLAHWVLSGYYAIFTHIQKDGNDVVFCADQWDPITVYPKYDNWGVQKLVRTYEVDRTEAEAMAQAWADQGLDFDYTEPSYEAKTRIINYWLRRRIKDKKGKWYNEVYNAIAIGDTKANTTIIKPLEKEDFKRIPVFTGAVGNPERTLPDWPSRYGENIIASNRDMYDYTNTLLSLSATIMAETAYPNLVSNTKTGNRVTKDGMKGYGSEYALKINESVSLLKHAATPPEVQVLLQLINNMKQKGSLPDVVYGGIDVELSGFAISQLMAAIKYKLAPYLTTMQMITGNVATEFLSQYRSGKFGTIKLSTVNPQDMKKGMFYVEEFAKTDIPEVTYIDVTIPITSSMDKTQQILFATQALEARLLSRETLWDSYMDVQDAEQEYARILQDDMLQDQFVRDVAIVEQMRKREQLYRYEGKEPEANAMHQYIMQKEMSLGMRQAIPQTSGQGVPSNVMPPEMRNNPDQMRAAGGVPPSGVNRTAQTPQQRTETQNQKIIIP